MEILIIGRQVTTEYGGRIDLLGIDRQGELVIIELKRDQTPRDVVGQVLDYATWVKGLTYSEINSLANHYLEKDLSVAFSQFFGEAIPEKVNTGHKMVIVAPQLDETSERIVQYLAEDHDLNINAVFFKVFRKDGEEFIGRAWLMDPMEVQTRIEAKNVAPWSGYWFVNVGEGGNRNWDDNRKYGFISAGQGPWYSGALKRLKTGDRIFAYMKGYGYVGYGRVIKEALMIKDFIVEDEQKHLLDLELVAPEADANSENPDLSEWVLGIDWHRQFARGDAKTFKGAFANQNVVCKLRHPETVEFLRSEFDLSNEE